MYVGRVVNHKLTKDGAASVVYALPGLYKAVKTYVEIFRGGQVVTTLGNKVKPAMPHKHLKEKILSKLDILSEEQLKKLTSKAWRKVILSNVLAYFVTKLFLSNDKFRNILETFIQHCSMFPSLRWGLCKIIELLNCVVFVGKLFDSNDRVKNIIQLCMQHLVYFHTT